MARVLAALLLASFAGVRPAQNSDSPLAPALQHFYSARYELAAEAAAPFTKPGPLALPAYELRTSALHFQIKRLLGDASNKGRAFRQCTPCPALLEAFMKDLTQGKALARAALKAEPQDEWTLYYFGKLDLNYVWLQLSTLGARTGWGEYWNARRSLDAVLKINPQNTRARVARAWIDYIVDTRVPFGMQWVLGGGDKNRALRTLTEAAATPVPDPFVHAEAEFALWEMLVREKRQADARVVAGRLLQTFPDNQDLQKFLKKD
jgi:tetratricopeptide (TPR) repeat protein